jgi:hypothetical protein
VRERFVAEPQLSLQIAHRQMRSNAGEHFFGLEWFVDEVHGAEIEAARLLKRFVECREKNDRGIARARIGLETGAGFEPVDVGHHDVEQDEIGPRALGDRDRVLAAARGEQTVALPLERLIEHVQIRRVVVDEQDLESHVHDSSESTSS